MGPGKLTSYKILVTDGASLAAPLIPLRVKPIELYKSPAQLLESKL